MKPLCVPADPNYTLYPVNPGEDQSTGNPYHAAVGSLIFLAIFLRPDIAYAVSNVSKYLNNNNGTHW